VYIPSPWQGEGDIQSEVDKQALPLGKGKGIREAKPLFEGAEPLQ